METIIEFKNCTKSFGKNTVLNDISFKIKKDTGIVSVLGKSGSGKTTLLRLLAGLEIPEKGEIFINGKTVCKNGKNIIPPHKRNIGFIFQDLALFPHFTVFENIAFGLKLKKQSDYKNTVNEILKKFEIYSLKNNYPNQLSGGQQQLVALARSLVPEPEILLTDEPTANLDVKLKKKIEELLNDIVKQNNIIILSVTHDHKDAIKQSSEILMLNKGKIAFFGTSDEIIHTKNISVTEFLEI
ncbi:MAG: ABC transporter ATP-binding protein [Bacteroidales bacterium]|nr:ABC transporter ATP-binding protein [Bacteroidales bacterium]